LANGIDAVFGAGTVDFALADTNSLENGTNTFYLIDAGSSAGRDAIVALLGSHIETGTTTSLPSMGTVLDSLARIDEGGLGPATTDIVFDGAPIGGGQSPTEAEDFNAPGFYRAGDYPAPWCGAYLPFNDVSNAPHPRTPGTPG